MNLADHRTDLPRRLFALIPAAGRSRRMGSPKLLLAWNGSTVIEQLLSALRRPEIVAVYVVVRPDDIELQSVLSSTTATVIVPDHDPPDMRDSVEIGLNAIRNEFRPTADDGWMLIPADHPLIEREVLDGMLQHWFRNDCQALVPKFGDRRGHPTLMRWSLAEQVQQLPHEVGINTLLRSSATLVTEWPTPHESVLADLDTPEDYAHWLQRLA